MAAISVPPGRRLKQQISRSSSRDAWVHPSERGLGAELRRITDGRTPREDTISQQTRDLHEELRARIDGRLPRERVYGSFEEEERWSDYDRRIDAEQTERFWREYRSKK